MTYADTLERIYNGKVLLRERFGGNASEALEDSSYSDSKIDSLISDCYFFGISEYILHGDVASLRENLALCSMLAIHLVERYDASQSIDESYVTMYLYKHIFGALTACDFASAKKLAKLLGGREEIEEKHDLKVVRALGYLTKATLLEDKIMFESWKPEFVRCCEEDYYFLEGVGLTLQSIFDMNLQDSIDGIQKVVKEHRTLTSKNGWFHDSPDELLSIFGVGLTNLARYRGLMAPAIPPLVPESLLVSAFVSRN